MAQEQKSLHWWNLIFCEDESNNNLTICPRHRDVYGLRWRCNKRNCAVTQKIAVRKLKRAKDEQGIEEVNQSAMIFQSSGVVVPIPIGCYEYKILSSLVGRGREGENLRD